MDENIFHLLFGNSYLMSLSCCIFYQWGNKVFTVLKDVFSINVSHS